MSTSSSQPYTIFCFLIGEDSAFPIEIERNKTFGHLKDKIKEKKGNRLANFDANELKLYQLDIIGDERLAKAVEEKLLELPDELGARKVLDQVFEDGVKEETLIIVQPPKSGK